MKKISGGVCAARGFCAAGVHCGVMEGSSPEKNDLALILSQRECAAAGVYTLNRVKGASVYVTMAHLGDGAAWGIVANSGNANACCAGSHESAEEMCAAAAAATGREPGDFLVASTGLIGRPLNLAAIREGLPRAAAALSAQGSDAAARAIMTSDRTKKELACSLTLGGREVRLGAVAKGSAMIHPNMGTMLCFLTTDCAITAELLEDALREVTAKTFNRVTVDGDTSPNDTCVILANGMAGNPLIEWKDEDYETFKKALAELCRALARAIAADGEGAGRLVTCVVAGARSEENAERLAKAVASSTLVKAAMGSANPNWGRVMTAMGCSKAPFRPERVDIAYRSDAGELLVCSQGDGVDFDAKRAGEILAGKEVVIAVDLHEGEESAECWGCDLTGDYLHVNGEYST